MLKFRTMGQRVLAGSFIGLVLGLSGLVAFASSRLGDLEEAGRRDLAIAVAQEWRASLNDQLATLRGGFAGIAETLGALECDEATLNALLQRRMADDARISAFHWHEAKRGLTQSLVRTEIGGIERHQEVHSLKTEATAPHPELLSPDQSFVGNGATPGLDYVMDLPGREGSRIGMSLDLQELIRGAATTELTRLGASWALLLDRRPILAAPMSHKPDALVDMDELERALPPRGHCRSSPHFIEVLLPVPLSVTTEARFFVQVQPVAFATSPLDQGLVLGLGLLGLGVGLGSALLAVRPLIRRLRLTADRLADIAHGDHDLTIKLDLDGHGEVATLGRNFDRFVEQIRELIQGIAETAAALDENTDDIENKTRSLRTLCQSSREAAERTTNASTDVAMNLASAEREVSAMSENFLEITEDIERSTASARHAAELATGNAKTIQNLGERSNEIDQFVEVINGIAEQTNLLALNATIEAARAGESGKGFAVVANEVKTLAQEAAHASETIRLRIEAIQTEIRAAVRGSESIDEAIKAVNEISSRIAASVRSQATVTATINGALQDANRSVLSITAAAETAEHTAALNEQEAKQASATAMEVATISQNLRLMIDEFRY